MEEFYMAFKEKCIIHAEAQFDIESFKTACPDIYHQIGTCDWGPFTIPVDLYLPELVCEFYVSYRARQQLMERRGHTKAFPCLTLAKKQVTALPFPNLVSMLCMRVSCPLFRPLDRTVQDNNVITLATKIDKEAAVRQIESHNSPPLDLLNIAQRSNMHENQLVRFAKAIPSMIQNAIKKALQPAKDKLASLCSTVDVLESEVGT
ncbi:hypothetical protein HAX54_033126 [Datura stramonium]|uniref:Uncharacterized protein n=1 Tax=Datura stramonium TaxID=4076 RepID=A0ABS8VD53_DATST|nr:hypothetical protein [Datura stramonium]